MIQKWKNILIAQVKQGATPHKLALSLAFGAILGIIPLLGVVTWLCVMAGIFFKLNHIVIQLAQNLIYPLQLILIIPYCRAGEWLFGVEPIPLNLSDVIDQFGSNFVETFQKYLATGLMGVVVWILTSPLLFMLIYQISKRLLSKLIVNET